MFCPIVIPYSINMHDNFVGSLTVSMGGDGDLLNVAQVPMTV